MSYRAIAYFQERLHSDVSFEEMHYNNMAILALEKQVPKLVNHEKTFWTYRHFCPACSGQLRIEALKYCDLCGQKLDWSNYWEGLKRAR